MTLSDAVKMFGSPQNLEETQIIWKKLAKKYHPDVSKEKNAAQNFQMIQQAKEYFIQFFQDKKNKANTEAKPESKAEAKPEQRENQEKPKENRQQYKAESKKEEPYKNTQRQAAKKEYSQNVKKIVVDPITFFKGGVTSITTKAPCPYCNGIGCYFCSGTGIIDQEVRIKIPQNAIIFSKIVILKQEYMLHPKLKRNEKIIENNLYIEKNISQKLYEKGGTFKIKDPSGQQLSIKLQPLSPKVLKLQEKGYPGPSKRYDMYIGLKVKG